MNRKYEIGSLVKHVDTSTSVGVVIHSWAMGEIICDPPDPDFCMVYKVKWFEPPDESCYDIETGLDGNEFWEKELEVYENE